MVGPGHVNDGDVAKNTKNVRKHNEGWVEVPRRLLRVGVRVNETAKVEDTPSGLMIDL